MRIYTESKDFLQFNKATVAFLVLNFAGIILTLLYNDTIIIDMWEHLRASYLVSTDHIPYRDFFEHHHPTLWYVFTPFINIMPENSVLIFYVARFISLICNCGTLYVIFLIIKRFLGGKTAFMLFLLIFFSFFPVWYVLSAFKPEAFANLFYFAGMYYCFDYIQNSKRKGLIYGSILFMTAFLFIQTMIFNIALIGMILILLCYKRQKFLQDIFFASALPLIILASLVVLLYKQDLLELYIQTNWLYNLKLSSGDNLEIWYWGIQISLALYAFVWCYKTQKSVYFNIIGILLISEILMIFVFHKTFPHYLFLTFIYTSILISNMIKNIQNKTLQTYIYVFFAVSLILNYLTVFLKNNTVKMDEFEIVNQSQQNTVLNINSQIMNIYGKQTSYYELFPINMYSIDICEFNRFSDYNLEQDITKNKYTYLVYNSEKKTKPLACKNEIFTLKRDTLNNYQQITDNLWKIKK